jgi:hypothetical protein
MRASTRALAFSYLPFPTLSNGTVTLLKSAAEVLSYRAVGERMAAAA